MGCLDVRDPQARLYPCGGVGLRDVGVAGVSGVWGVDVTAISVVACRPHFKWRGGSIGGWGALCNSTQPCVLVGVASDVARVIIVNRAVVASPGIVAFKLVGVGSHIRALHCRLVAGSTVLVRVAGAFINVAHRSELKMVVEIEADREVEFALRHRTLCCV